ncbi:MAG: LysM peptidoglycan-binding domain-containing protein [Chitinophagaceae bacterium]|nr:LysM peptidoglycan-binding domain-containing protein [Polaromonas sp.]
MNSAIHFAINFDTNKGIKSGQNPCFSRAKLAVLIPLAFVFLGEIGHLHAQNLTVTADQKATAVQVAQSGIAVGELAPNAPDNYSVKRGDTLWGISGMFLKSPWRWPELWGMNLQDIKNPHRIYPGQQLYLDKTSGRAVLRTRQAFSDGPPTDVVKISPRTRSSGLGDPSIPTLSASVIEPFLAEPLIVDALEFARAPRFVATQEGRVMLTKGDRAYARGQYDDVSKGKAISDAKGEPLIYRVFRNATPLKDPTTGVILGYEAQFVGVAELIKGESTQMVSDKKGVEKSEVLPATFDILKAKEEIRIGDRLIAEPAPPSLNYVPHAPSQRIAGQIVSIYGSSVGYAAQNQVVVINKGSNDGMERGHVMAVLKDGERLKDKTDESKPQIKLPNERNGLLMVFRTFEKVSYALLLQITDGVKVGDRFVNPN